MKAETLRHNLERTWRRSHTQLDRPLYKHQCHLCIRMMTKAEAKYLADAISENSDNPRGPSWSCNSINNILHNSEKTGNSIHLNVRQKMKIKSLF